MENYDTSTIAAVSTAHGKGGIAVLRVSGSSAIEISEKVFFPIKGSLSDISSNMTVYGHIYYRGEKIDDGMATVFRAPKSFTGEDTVEISCHGSEIGTSMVLSALLEAGAVIAEPGEFTKRAFLSGKITLSQAEAIGELIDAESSASARLSAAKLSGVMGEKINSLASAIMNILTSVYAYIDYPDEDIADMSAGEMRIACRKVLSGVSALLSTYDTGRAISKGIPSAIVGAPNVGKSSFLNLLTGTDRAIVTDIAGTTRDVITESVSIGNIKLLLSDTAGIRETDDAVEKIGVERSKKELEASELVFALFDTSRDISGEDREIIKVLCDIRQREDKKIIVLLNKSDKGTFADSYRAELSDFEAIDFCTFDDSGKAALEKLLLRYYPSGDEEIRSGLIVTTARQYASLKNAEAALAASITALETLTPDMCCAELESAVRALYEIDGRSVNEKIVEGIFSHFCVGK